MTPTGWRLYYTDDRAYSSASVDWIATPDDGVLVLVVYYDRYSDGGVQHRLVLDGDDYYFHVPGTDVFGCNNDPPAEIRERYPGASIKRGQWASADEFYAAKTRAYDAPCP